MAVGVRHQFIGLLAGGVEAHRVVHRLPLMERQIAIAAVDRAAGGVHQILGAVVTASLKDVAEPHQVALDVSRRVLQRVPHPRLGRQIDHHLGPFGREQGHQGVAVLQRTGVELPGIRWSQCFDFTQPGLLEGRVVIVVQAVDADHPITPLQQALGQSGTDEPGSAGDENRSRHQPSPSPTRHNVKPAARTCSGSVTARESNTQAGRRIRPASSCQFSSRY